MKHVVHDTWRLSETPAITLTLVALAVVIFVPDATLQQILFGLILVSTLFLGACIHHLLGQAVPQLWHLRRRTNCLAETEQEREILLTWREAMRSLASDELL